MQKPTTPTTLTLLIPSHKALTFTAECPAGCQVDSLLAHIFTLIFPGADRTKVKMEVFGDQGCTRICGPGELVVQGVGYFVRVEREVYEGLLREVKPSEKKVEKRQKPAEQPAKQPQKSPQKRPQYLPPLQPKHPKKDHPLNQTPLTLNTSNNDLIHLDQPQKNQINSFQISNTSQPMPQPVGQGQAGKADEGSCCQLI